MTGPAREPVNLPEMQVIAHRDLNAEQARAITERIKSSRG